MGHRGRLRAGCSPGSVPRLIESTKKALLHSSTREAGLKEHLLQGERAFLCPGLLSFVEVL